MITVDGHLLVPVSTPDEQVRANTPEAPEGPPSPSSG